MSEPTSPDPAHTSRYGIETRSVHAGTPPEPVTGARNMPIFQTTAYVFEELSKQLPQSSENAEAAVIGDQLYVRASVKLSDFGGSGSLGPLASMMSDREQAQFGGSLEVIRSGLAEYHVKQIKIRDLTIPQPMIPRLLRNIEHGTRPAGLAEDALPLVIPSYIADVRVGKGKVTLYKVTQ